MVSYKGLTLAQKWEFKDTMNRLNARKRYADKMMSEHINDDEKWLHWFETYSAVLDEIEAVKHKMFMAQIENLSNHEPYLL